MYLVVVTANLCPFVALFSTVDTLDFYPSTSTLPKRRVGLSMNFLHQHCQLLEGLRDTSRAPCRARTRTRIQTDAVRVQTSHPRATVHLRRKRINNLSSDFHPLTNHCHCPHRQRPLATAVARIVREDDHGRRNEGWRRRTLSVSRRTRNEADRNLHWMISQATFWPFPISNVAPSCSTSS